MSVIIVDTNGELKMDTIQHSGYKSYGNLQHVWKTLKHDIQLYGKKRGKIENKYEFPSPIDVQFYGNCLLVNPSGNLTIEMWNEAYESIQVTTVENESEDYNAKDTFETDELEEEPYKIDLNSIS